MVVTCNAFLENGFLINDLQVGYYWLHHSERAAPYPPWECILEKKYCLRDRCFCDFKSVACRPTHVGIHIVPFGHASNHGPN